LVYAVQIPRLGLGIGVFGLAGFVDHVVVLTLTNGASLGQVPCKRITLDRVVHVGANVTTILPIPVVETLLRSLAWKKEVWKAPQWKKNRARHSDVPDLTIFMPSGLAPDSRVPHDRH
jgi:hypothetical protein